MATLYYIKDWAGNYENNRTRELKHMDWVPIPTKFDGDGYTELMDHPNGTAHFGAWIAMVKLAAKCGNPAGRCDNPAGACGGRGTLLRDVGKPHDSASLSRITRIPQQVFDEAIPRFLAIGWLGVKQLQEKQLQQIPQEGAGLPQEGAAAPQETALNGMEGNTISASSDAAAQSATKTAKEPRQRKPRRQPTGPHAEAIRAFCERWKKRWGTDYAFQDGKDGSAIKWMLGQLLCDPKAMERLIDAYLSDSDTYVVDARHPVSLLRARINRYLPTVMAQQKPETKSAGPAVTRFGI